MQKDFDKCAKNGGKVKTKNLKGNRFIRICYDKNGKSHAGEVMHRKKNFKSNKKQNNSKKQTFKSKTLEESLLELKAHYDERYRF